MNSRFFFAAILPRFILSAVAICGISSRALGQDSAEEPKTGQSPSAVDPAAIRVDTGAPGNTGVAASGDGHQHENPVDADSVMEKFKAAATPEQLEMGLALLKDFETHASEFQQKVIEMRREHTLYINKMSDTKAPYWNRRNEARDLMNQTYRDALKLVEIVPHPHALRFIVTVLEQRYNNDVYDAETYEGAAKLLDYKVRLRYVALSAARSAMAVGDFDLAERIYDNLDPDELEDEDRGLIALAEEIKRQFEIEEKLKQSQVEELPKVRFLTTRGDFTVELYIDSAPSTVSHFISLAESGFYDGLDFFQVIDGLFAMTGDPLGDGSSRPDRFLADEHGRPGSRMPVSGSLVMAKLPIPNTRDFVPNSAGTQFAIMYFPFPLISDQRTVFGRVIDGLDVVGALRRVDPTKKKEKNAIVAPPDRILKCEVLNRPEKLPEVNYAAPIGPSAPLPSAAPALPSLPGAAGP